jgi:hypothetical protein
VAGRPSGAATAALPRTTLTKIDVTRRREYMDHSIEWVRRQALLVGPERCFINPAREQISATPPHSN